MSTPKQHAAQKPSIASSLEGMVLLGIAVCLVLLLATPLILSVRTIFPFLVGKTLASRSLIELLFGLWVVLAVLRPAYRPRRSMVLIAFSVWVAVSLLASLTGVSLQRSLWSTYQRMQGVIDLAHWLALVLMLSSVLRPGLASMSWLPARSSRRERRRGADEFSLSEYAVTALGSLLSWRGLLNVNLGISLFVALMGLDLHYDIGLVPTYEVLSVKTRLGSTLGNPGIVEGYMLVNMFIALAFVANSFAAGTGPRAETAPARRRRRRRDERPPTQDSGLVWWQAFWVLVVALTFWALLLSGTRGSIFVGLPTGLVFFCAGYLLWGQERTVKVVSVLVLGGMVLLGLVIVGVRTTDAYDRLADANATVGRIRAINLNDGSIKVRIASHEAGFEGFLARPLLGWGPENYNVAFGRYFDFDPEVRENFDQAHNKLLEEMTTKGILGLASYVALWTAMFAIVYRRIRDPDDSEQVFMLFIGAALTGYFFQNLFLFDTPATMLQFAVLVGFTASLERTQEASAEARDGVSQRTPNGEGAPTTVRAWVLPALAIVGVSGLIALGIVINTRIYYASKMVVNAQVPTISWEERLDFSRRSIDSFQPLANYTRMWLVDQVFKGIRARTMSDRELERAMAMVEREAYRATESEPEEWKIYADLAKLYYMRFDAARDAKYHEQADSYLESAIQLGPETLEVTDLKRLA